VAFAAVARNAVLDRRAGICTGLGVAAGSLVHTTAAVAGVAAVLAAHRSLFTALQVAGGVYLIYLGVRTPVALRRERRRPTRPASPTAEERCPARAFRQGFVVNVTNPKAPVLFFSLLPQFVPPGVAPVARSLVLSLIVVACALLWFPAAALGVHAAGALLGGVRVRRALALATSLLLLALGLRLVLFG
jgi:threonine/homoserine/homoserine lactone efflux protein